MYADCIKRLRQDRHGIVTNYYSNIINLANVELTTIEKEVLCHGVDFGVPPRISEREILAEFELLQNNVSTLRLGPSSGNKEMTTVNGNLSTEMRSYQSLRVTLAKHAYARVRY